METRVEPNMVQAQAHFMGEFIRATSSKSLACLAITCYVVCIDSLAHLSLSEDPRRSRSQSEMMECDEIHADEEWSDYSLAP
jgi:hypothetical protein